MLIQVCCGVWTLCHTIQHRAVLIIFPLKLQTITITRMLSSEGEGVSVLLLLSLLTSIIKVMWKEWTDDDIVACCYLAAVCRPLQRADRHQMSAPALTPGPCRPQLNSLAVVSSRLWLGQMSMCGWVERLTNSFNMPWKCQNSWRPVRPSLSLL